MISTKAKLGLGCFCCFLIIFLGGVSVPSVPGEQVRLDRTVTYRLHILDDSSGISTCQYVPLLTGRALQELSADSATGPVDGWDIIDILEKHDDFTQPCVAEYAAGGRLSFVTVAALALAFDSHWTFFLAVLSSFQTNSLPTKSHLSRQYENCRILSYPEQVKLHWTVDKGMA